MCNLLVAKWEQITMSPLLRGVIASTWPESENCENLWCFKMFFVSSKQLSHGNQVIAFMSSEEKMIFECDKPQHGQTGN